MIIEGYGIRLERLCAKDIEFLREKRNRPEVNAYMEYREYISTEAQQAWFQRINNEYNNYFLIEYQGERIGLISGAEIDWDKNITGNGGLFLWERSYWGTSVPVYASFLLTEVSFMIGFRKTFIRTLENNERAMEFNRSLGYVPEREAEEVHNKLFSLSSENFENATGKLREALRRKHPKIKLTLFKPFDTMSMRVYERVQTVNPGLIEVEIVQSNEH